VISDFLPMNMRETSPLLIAAPAVALLAANQYTFNQTITRTVQGSALYLFDRYSFCANVTQEQFAHCIGFGAASVTNDEFVPVVSFAFAGVQSGTPEYFPLFRPAAYGFNDIRAFGMAPSDDNFQITIRVQGVVKWDIATYASPPPFMTLLFGLNAYQIKDQNYIAAYRDGKMLPGNQWRY